MAVSSEPTKRLPGRGKKKLPEGEPADHALGRSRGGFSTKIHLITDGHGLPLVVAVSPGQQHETQQAEPLVERLPDLGNGLQPKQLVGDKGYSAQLAKGVADKPLDRAGHRSQTERSGCPGSV